jgi:dolichyl-phosphate-mannose--protein O-mannosyl transferase
MMARATSAVLGTACIAMTYVIGKKLFSGKVGLIAALFLCVNENHVELSHYARVDATLCLIVLVAFYFIVKSYKESSRFDIKIYVLAGIFSGIAFQTKAPGIILVIPFFVMELIKGNWRTDATGTMKAITTYILFFVVGLAIGNPASILAPLKFVMSLLGMGQVYTTALNETKSADIGFVFYLKQFIRSMAYCLILCAFSVAFSAC